MELDVHFSHSAWRGLGGLDSDYRMGGDGQLRDRNGFFIDFDWRTDITASREGSGLNCIFYKY